jgi:hypothetical protein
MSAEAAGEWTFTAGWRSKSFRRRDVDSPEATTVVAHGAATDLCKQQFQAEPPDS